MHLELQSAKPFGIKMEKQNRERKVSGGRHPCHQQSRIASATHWVRPPRRYA